ncbi:LCP family protein [Microbacterium sp. P05]|uniref:LCP family protein n=1 Tax=Microbacterium sp. P05 TaxID=3366948 RepID=UPI003744CE58
MSVISAPRHHRPVQPRLIETRPLRNPDLASANMMTRRGWWLVALNFLLPGSAQVLAGSRKLGRFGLGATVFLWALLILAGLCALLWPAGAFSIVAGLWIPAPLSLLRPVPLLLIQALFIAYAVLWIVLTIDTLRLVKLVKAKPLSRIGIPVLALVLVAVSSSAAAYGAQVTGSTREALSSIFGSSAEVVPPSDGYYNILLLGADSGEGRDSMRFDSISVVSVNADTGATTITGIPRDLGHFPFSEGPMKTLYPDVHTGKSDPNCGWGSGINQLRTEVEVCRDGDSLYPDARDNNSEPGVEATKDAAEGLLGIEIPYYVFIDMHGFAEMVDALGGVDITVDERLPEGGGPRYSGESAEEWASGWIEAGPQHMDGDTAQWYARSRYTTSDFDRMRRQRQLQEAMIAQFTPQTVLTRYQGVAAATSNLMQTDLPQGLLPMLADLALKAKEQPVTTIELTPDGAGVDQDKPNVAAVQEVIRAALHPPTAEPSP